MIETVSPYEGTFSSRSGSIGDSQYSSLLLTTDVLSDAPITFYSKVSSEANYDFLVFIIDGAEIGRWSGEVPWTKRTYPVTEGMHTFQWKYIKDVNTVGGSDCAWLDYIIMPPMGEWLLSVYAGTDDSMFSMHPLFCGRLPVPGRLATTPLPIRCILPDHPISIQAL